MSSAKYHTSRIDHLGIVSGICEQINLPNIIDGIIGETDREVSVGEATKAMVINALGFVGRALYLTPEYYQNKPVDLLVSEGIEAEQLNDDSLGTALDLLYEHDLTTIFYEVATEALEMTELDRQFVHLDSSTISFEGSFDQDDKEEVPIRIEKGYSRDNRPDLNQVVISLISSYKSSLPQWFDSISGSRVDKESFPKTIQAYLDQLREGECSYVIADAELFTDSNLREISSRVDWVSRVPMTITEAKTFRDGTDLDEMRQLQEGYFGVDKEVEYADVPQRWICIYSEKAYERDKKAQNTRIRKEREALEKQARSFSRKEFDERSEAIQQAEQLLEEATYHTGDIKTEKVAHYNSRGRPASDQEPDFYRWKAKIDVEQDQQVIKTKEKTLGKFILATSEMDRERLPAEQVLEGYKGQRVSVERGFRFLKDPMFFASGLYLENEERIMATLMIMGLALLVYSLAEHKLRKRLREEGETIPDQKGTPYQNPTMRRVFQIFEGVDILTVDEEADGTGERKIMNLNETRKTIIRMLGPEIKRCYMMENNKKDEKG